jgi:magnesium-protoporphyrin O-methyltransferase
MNCCAHVNALDEVFGRHRAQYESKKYWKKGLGKTSQKMVEILKARGVAGSQILEIGFGIGALHLELLKAGAARAVGLELSPAYVEAAERLAERLGLKQAVEYHLRNLAEDPSDVAEADLVVMNRVVCCYPDMPGLVKPAAERTRRFLALTFPRDAWWVRLGVKLINGILALIGSSFRTYHHDPRAIRAVAVTAGLAPVFETYSGPWQIGLFERAARSSAIPQ